MGGDARGTLKNYLWVWMVVVLMELGHHSSTENQI